MATNTANWSPRVLMLRAVSVFNWVPFEDVASRGLDLPRVDWVLQWNAPATPTDYVHRVGRTARAGKCGAALLFLAETETLFLEDLMKKGIRLKEETVDRCLQNLFSAGMTLGMFQRHESRSVDAAVASVQLRFEDAVVGRPSLHKMAYTSFVRFYAAYPKESRNAFCFRRLHLGHYAKGFALRDTPSAIGVNAQPGKGPPGLRSKAPRQMKRGGGAALKMEAVASRSKMLITSEYASGLDDGPPKKKRKK
ncbi:hypothetical protein J437_LFUL010412 [Ladona fulva]|uniref:ATP-dependent RNA helicase n=1 Tax=Ladona fulva TaxID=123851 RepID=A0A8K0K840_LADFU|nr:hypothetical protein J437_LFUL010412 [Ladona fulva]